jgi:hypothetical protein
MLRCQARDWGLVNWGLVNWETGDQGLAFLRWVI